jgi:hypothetical protein
MKKFILISIIILLQSCFVPGPYTREEQKKSIEKYLNSSDGTTFVLREIGKWEWSCYKKKCEWERHQDWFDFKTGIISSGWTGFRENDNDKYFKTSTGIIRDFGEEYLIYVGRWHYVEKMGKEIRAVAESKNGLRIFFEFKNEENSKIPYKPLTLNRKIKTGGFNFESDIIYEIKWYDTYGYNAYYDKKTGTIKQAEE